MQLIVASPLGYLVPNEVLCIEKVESVCRHCNCVVPMRKMPIFFVLSILQHESLLDAISSLNLSLSASIIFFLLFVLTTIAPSILLCILESIFHLCFQAGELLLRLLCSVLQVCLDCLSCSSLWEVLTGVYFILNLDVYWCAANNDVVYNQAMEQPCSITRAPFWMYTYQDPC